MAMISRSQFAGLSLLALMAPLPALAQGAEGVSSFRTGLKGRIVEQRESGVEPVRDAAGRIDAGYYRLRFDLTGVTEAGSCPRAAFKTTQEFTKWRSDESAMYQKIFDKEGVWSLTARTNLHVQGIDKVSREIRLIAIENPEEKNCKVKLVGTQDGDTAILDAASVMVPFDPNNTVYDDQLRVAFKSVYKLEPNDARLDQLWAGINLFATTVSAGLGPIVSAATPLGKTETAKLLTDDVEVEAASLFEADPGQGQRANKIFVHLGFPPLPKTLPATLTGGMTFFIDYRASLFRRGQFYSTTFPAGNPIKANDVLSVTPIPALNPPVTGLRTVREALPTAVYDSLAKATTTDLFDGACPGARTALRALDLSPVDADIFLWAVASQSQNEAVSKHLGKLKCFGSDQRDNLRKMGIVVVDETLPPPETTKATLASMHSAMTSLATLMQGAAAGAPLNPDLTERFADKIRLVMADETTQQMMKQPEINFERLRDEALTLITQNFSNLGCYAPRLGRDSVMLPLRPNFFELPTNGRASAAIALSREAAPRAFIFSFGFAPVLGQEKPKIATIVIGRRGADSGEVIQQIIADRRPVSCMEGWMDEVFK
jgi:hypothetical protein